MGLIEVAVLDDSYKLNERYFNNNSYLEWLESFTIDDQLLNSNKNYSKLLRALWDIPFYGAIGNDTDRGEEGLELRVRYNDILSKKSGKGEFYTPDVRELFGECRVLEMLIALSMHMYDLMQDMGIYNSVSRWFWEIMKNVGFDKFDDAHFNRRTKYMITKTVDDILNLNSDASNPHTRGGWFYNWHWQEIEIWYQMHEYLRGYFN